MKSINLSQCCHIFSWLSLQWRHNERDGVSNHRRLHCLLNVSSVADQRKHQSSESLVFVQGIRRSSVNSPHKRPVTQKMFPFDDVIMCVLGGCTIIYCEFRVIYPGELGFCLYITTVQSVICANNWAQYGLKVVFVCLHITLSHYHHYADHYAYPKAFNI